MKKNAILIAILFFVSCSKKDPSPINKIGPAQVNKKQSVPVNKKDSLSGHKLVLLTLDATKFATNSYADYWFFISDKSGKVVAAKELTQPDILTFTETADPDSGTTLTAEDSVTLTYIIAIKTDNTRLLFSYGGVKVNSGLEFGPNIHLLADKTFPSSCSITVTNFPFNDYVVMSAPGDSYRARSSGGEVNGFVFLSADTTSVLLSGYTSEMIPVYQWKHQVKPDDHIITSFSDFVPFPKTIPITFTGLASSFLAAYSDDTNDPIVTFNDRPASPTQPPMGYLEGYKSYGLIVTGTNGPDTYVTYNKRGAISTSFSLPSFAHSVTNTSVQNFDFSIDRPFTYGSYTWKCGPSILWNVYSPNNYRPKFSSIPSDVVTMYPELDLEKFVYQNSSVFDRLDGITYRQFVDYSFGGMSNMNTYEYQEYKFKN